MIQNISSQNQSTSLKVDDNIHNDHKKSDNDNPDKIEKKATTTSNKNNPI